MNLWEAVFCGIIQGLTEFLPVSSSGHLALAHTFFGMADVETHLSFDILLHFATLIVVFVVYHKDIFDLFTVLGCTTKYFFCLIVLKHNEIAIINSG